jgi:hypothetical protein
MKAKPSPKAESVHVDIHGEVQKAIIIGALLKAPGCIGERLCVINTRNGDAGLFQGCA